MTTNTKRAVCPRRSFIFSPGLKPDMFPKALASGADIVCVELEDGIAPKDKDEARKKALALFETPQANAHGRGGARKDEAQQRHFPRDRGGYFS